MRLPRGAPDVIPLPIDAVLPEIRRAVATRRGAVVVAPPGSGKTTRVPPDLLDRVDGRVLVLQPRRVAARLTARRIARERGWRLGGRIGWRIRFEDRTGPDTRLIVLTEGLMTRWLQDDPFLDGVGAVVLDEVHERSVHTDLALAFLADVRKQARPDLVVVAMSATLDAGPLARFLDAPVVHASGRTFPVAVSWEPGDRPDDLARIVRRELSRGGHVLVFLAGRRDIARAADALADLPVPVLPLHGGLPVDAQQRALAPSDTPRVVLATNLAETSVTLPDVGAVVDTGWVKVTRFDPRLGLTRLVRERVSAASADQRAGRAGRTAAGRCVRLWPRGEPLRPHLEPEIARTDLAGVLLQVLAWGSPPDRFPWFERPPDALVSAALTLLARLGAMKDGPDPRLTPLGRTLATLPLHPRLGAVVVEGHRRGLLTAAAGAAALASEPDPFPEGVPGAAHADDLLARLAVLDQAPRVARVQRHLVAVARRILGPGGDGAPVTPEALVRCLLAGFPDRLGRRTGPRRYRLPLGGAELDPRSLVEDAAFIVAVSMTGADRAERARHRIHVASPVDPAWLPTTPVTEVVFHDGAVVERTREVFAGLVIRERTRPAWDDALLARHATVADLTVDDRAADLLARLALLRDHVPELEIAVPDLEALLADLCVGRRTLTELRAVDLARHLEAGLPHPVRRALADDAPPRLRLPSGSTAPIRYTPRGPVLSARVQQLFGWTETPRVARGRVPVTLEILSPAHRPVQVTRDLAGFWRDTYAEVRRELRGRYPRHAWPEDPTTAQAEDRPRRRR